DCASIAATRPDAPPTLSLAAWPGSATSIDATDNATQRGRAGCGSGVGTMVRLCLTSPPGSDCASTRTWASGSDPGAGPSGPPDYGRMRARSWGLTGAVPGARRHSGAWSGLWQLERTARSGRQKSYSRAPVAQLDRVPGYEPGGREFESLRARQSNQQKQHVITSAISHSSIAIRFTTLQGIAVIAAPDRAYP